MGRITVFTGNDVNSKLVLAELERRRLPYAEIAVDESRLRDVQALCEVPSVPQVFFNTRHVGGVDAVRRELRHLWDKTSRYRTPLEKYEAEIAENFDPTNERLALQEKTPKKISSHAALSVLSPTSIALPDGTTTSYRDITEKLKNTLPTVEVRRNGVLHHHIFTGMAAIKIFTSSLGISKEKAIAFGTELLRAQVIQPLVQRNNGSKSKTKKPSLKFLADDKAHYRLQCFHQPAILNSYCIWKGQFPTTKPAKLVSDMIFLLNDIETAAMNHRGQVDYEKARQHTLYPLLEESVCELQKISSVDLPPSQKQKLSMALNIYQLMLRYAYFKVGIPLSESDRLKFLATLQFNICGTCYSFDDWYHVVLGRPKKGKPGLGIHEVDQRAILAMHTGAVGGSKHSLPFGSFCIDDNAVIDAQLEIAAMVFVGDDNNVSVRKKGDVVMLSNVFKLKRSDFNGVATDTDLLEKAVLPYANGKKKLQVTALIQSRSFQKFTYTEPTLGRHTNNSLWFDEQALEVDEKGLRGMLKRFRPPKLHKNERARLATLRSLNVLDTLEEERYDRITRMVQSTFDMPLVFVSLVDQNRQWFKSTVWQTNNCPRVPETGRDVSFCGHAIHQEENEVFIISNALEDDRFADNPLVTGDLGLRFYAGVPLAVPSEDGNGKVNIGTLCMIDTKPRNLDPDQVQAFKNYGSMITKEILRHDYSSSDMADHSHVSGLGSCSASTSSVVSLSDEADISD